MAFGWRGLDQRERLVRVTLRRPNQETSELSLPPAIMLGVLSFLFLCFSWLQTKLIARAQRLLLRVLAAGPVPRHVAFVMDGNRRYARMNHKQVNQGHADGYLALRRVRILILVYIFF